MRLVCHIGTPKTATTYLQETCAANAGWLAERGIVYPDLFAPDANHITLFYAAADYIHSFHRDYGLHGPEDVQRLRVRLSAALEAASKAAGPDGTVLVSSENLTGNITGRAGVERLHALVAPLFERIEVIVYLRRQDDAVLSMYGEYMRRGFSHDTFERFVDAVLAPRSPLHYLYYRRLLETWSAVFGRDALCVRLYDDARTGPGGVLADFIGLVAGTPSAPGLLDGLERIEPCNRSLSAPAMEFLRRMHPYIPFATEGGINPRGRFAARIRALPEGPRPRLSADQAARIMRHFAPANAWLRETFFPGRPAPLFPQREDLPPAGNLGQVSLDDFARFTWEMMK
jgi:hypothetical protein